MIEDLADIPCATESLSEFVRRVAVSNLSDDAVLFLIAAATAWEQYRLTGVRVGGSEIIKRLAWNTERALAAVIECTNAGFVGLPSLADHEQIALGAL